MADIRILTMLMKGLYGAEVLPTKKADNWVNDDEELIIGYCFPDSKKALYLLSASDRSLLTDGQRRQYEETGRYPFNNTNAIVYKDASGKTCYRIVNGIASALGNFFCMWKEWDESGVNIAFTNDKQET